MRRVRLGRGHPDLRPGLRVEYGIAFAGQAAARRIADGQRPATAAPGHADRGQGIGRLAGLRHGHHQGAGGQLGIAVAEFAAQLRLHRQARQGLDNQPAVQARVKRSAATDDDHPPEPAPVVVREPDLLERHGITRRDMPRQQGAQDPRLLMDFLAHEGLESRALGGLGLQPDFHHFRRHHGAVQFEHLDAPGLQNGDFPILEVNHSAGPVKNGRHVAGDEVLAFAHPDDQRTAQPCGEQGVRLIQRVDAQSISAPGLGQREPDRRRKVLGARL